jgi:putative DNA methylase
VIKEARKHILAAHAEKLTKEIGTKVTVKDIEGGRAPRPRVLDVFAGGGGIPLEALRLGCEAYALDLNPLAHLIELCTLVYPQKYGKPDPKERGMTGPKSAMGETTWGGLANEVRFWGEWVLDKMQAEIGNLYPLIPDPAFNGDRSKIQAEKWQSSPRDKVPSGYLIPLAYLWTRTVRCKNPSCGAAVPLLRQSWLKKAEEGFKALRLVVPKDRKAVGFEVVESEREEGLGFDPGAFSVGGNTTCPFCGTVADKRYLKKIATAGRLGEQPVVIVATGRNGARQHYIPCRAGDLQQEVVSQRLQTLLEISGLNVPATLMKAWPGVINPPLSGLKTYRSLYNSRQLLVLMTCVKHLRTSYEAMRSVGIDNHRILAVLLLVSTLIDQLADWNCSLARWIPEGEQVGHALAGPGIGMAWDFVEINPFFLGTSRLEGSGTLRPKLDRVVAALESISGLGVPAYLQRGDAGTLLWRASYFDHIITDPPYYWNPPYSHLSDCVYVWLRLVLGDKMPEHFAYETTPKKKEAIASAVRDRSEAGPKYEALMTRAFEEGHRVLKPGGTFVCMYAHKTIAGWATLMESLRRAGFVVAQVWPIEMEKPGRRIAIDSAGLKSNIIVVARKREGAETGSYKDEVRPELERIVRERVDSFWKMGITGADLVIAGVGAALQAFTRFSRVEYANGEDVPAEKFLAEVEGAVLDTMVTKLLGITGGNVTAVDATSRFYILWRFVYKTAEIEAGEAIAFTSSQHVELDGPLGLSSGGQALLEKKKAKYRALDFTERRQHERLGLSTADGQPAPLIDVLHRILWLMENRPRKLSEFLNESRPDRERLRVIAQALAGAASSGKSEQAERLVSTTPAEQAALGKLLASWRNLIESEAPRPKGRGFLAR